MSNLWFFSRKITLQVLPVLILAVMGLQACTSSSAGLQVGDQAPPFSLTAADGRSISLDDYSGQPVLLYFHMAVG